MLPFLDRPEDVPLFSPAEAMEWRNEKRRQGRKTSMTPSQRARKRNKAPKRAPRDRYNAHGYYIAIRYAIKQANNEMIKANSQLPEEEQIPENQLPLLPFWYSYQLRHAAGSEIRHKHGLEASQVILGHKHAKVTEIYAERGAELARRIAGEVG